MTRNDWALVAWAGAAVGTLVFALWIMFTWPDYAVREPWARVAFWAMLTISVVSSVAAYAQICQNTPADRMHL